MWNKILRQCHTVMEPNMALSAACISLPLTINLSLSLPSHLKYNVSSPGVGLVVVGKFSTDLFDSPGDKYSWKRGNQVLAQKLFPQALLKHLKHKQHSQFVFCNSL